MDKRCTCIECLAIDPSGKTFPPSAYKAHRAKIAATQNSRTAAVHNVTVSLNHMSLSDASSAHKPLRSDDIHPSLLHQAAKAIPTPIAPLIKRDKHVRTRNILERFQEMDDRLDFFQAKLATPLTAEDISVIESGITTLRSTLDACRRQTTVIDNEKSRLEDRLDALEQHLSGVRSTVSVQTSPVPYDASKPQRKSGHSLLTFSFRLPLQDYCRQL